MPGMGPVSFSLTNPLVVGLFHHAVYGTAVAWIVGLALVGVVVAVLTRRISTFNLSPQGLGESRNRTYLRLAFGVIWLIDGVLQFQASMPLGLASNVVEPTAAGTPHWLHSLILLGVGVWNNHPVTLAVGTAWIQVGLGIALIVSNNVVGRVAAAVSVGWAALIWLIGNGAGGVFQSSSSILFGWPGATLFYIVAGIWLAGPSRNFPLRMSRWTARFMAVVLAIGALLQLLPNRGFWHGGNTNALTAMTQSMTQTPQPHPLAWFARSVGVVAGTLGGGANILIVLWLLGSAVGLWLANDRGWRWPAVTFVSGALLFWLSAQDGAIFGGLATDLNSLIPMAVLVWCSNPRLAAAPPVPRRLPREMRSATGSVFASFAAAMVLFSVVSMTWASLSSAETTLYLAQNGPAASANTKAPGFTLTDQFDHTYSLNEHAGRATLLTFLDPTCWTDCPLLAAQLKEVRATLGAGAKIDMVAVAADPYHETLTNVRTFIRKHQLGNVANFYFVTGKLKAVKAVWSSYGIGVSMKPTDKMSIHSDYMFIINGRGRLKWIIPDDPLSNWAGEHSAETELLSLLSAEGVH